METDFSDDAAFDRWMKAATADLKEEHVHARLTQPRKETGKTDDFTAGVTAAIDEIWAKAFPQLYPNHPINRPTGT